MNALVVVEVVFKAVVFSVLKTVPDDVLVAVCLHVAKIRRYYITLMLLYETLDLKNRFKLSNFDMLNKKIGREVSKNE